MFTPDSAGKSEYQQGKGKGNPKMVPVSFFEIQEGKYTKMYHKDSKKKFDEEKRHDDLGEGVVLQGLAGSTWGWRMVKARKSCFTLKDKMYEKCSAF